MIESSIPYFYETYQHFELSIYHVKSPTTEEGQDSRHTRLSRLTLSQQIKVLGTLYFHYSLQKQGHILRMGEGMPKVF